MLEGEGEAGEKFQRVAWTTSEDQGGKRALEGRWIGRLHNRLVRDTHYTGEDIVGVSGQMS